MTAFRKAGFSNTLSLRALIILAPMPGSFAHEGTRPQRATCSCRTASSSISRSSTIGTSSVGATFHDGGTHDLFLEPGVEFGQQVSDGPGHHVASTHGTSMPSRRPVIAGRPRRQGIVRQRVTVEKTRTALNEYRRDFVDFTPESGTITMFSTTWCGYCNRLKKQLDAQGIGYTEINIEEVEGTAELVEQLNGGNQHRPHRAVPGRHRRHQPSAAEVKSRLAA